MCFSLNETRRYVSEGMEKEEEEEEEGMVAGVAAKLMRNTSVLCGWAVFQVHARRIHP